VSIADKVINGLEGVKVSGNGRWIAKCPAHDDRSPSLSIRAVDDGRILIHCFAGCSVQDVLQAVGLDFSDLFDKPLKHFLPPIRGGFTAMELLRLNAHEATVATLIVSDALMHPLTDAQMIRLEQAAGRLNKAQALIHGR